ncbi:restriction endonuclease subunit S [Variovorax sp. OK605]|uniref:restriction endonuclease subunit S n=1 Tax=Variovorax sp. OK605 TaxID=1855317 RepID=UPI001C42F1B9
MKIKRLSPVQRGASPRPIDDPKYFDDDGEFSWVRIADVSASNGILSTTTQRMSELGASLSVKIQPGDLFVSIAGTVGKPCITTIKACIHDGFVYFPMLTIPPAFLYRVFQAGTCYAGLGKFGTQLNLNTDTVGSISIAVPPFEEILKVLIFLDREIAKIDTLIAEQEKLIALLAEKRQATISHAVTRGLNPDAPMKDSGVAWLGDVPAHWEVTRVKRVVSTIEQGWSPQCENFPVDGPEEWGVLKVGCVNGGTFDHTENKKLPVELDPLPKYALKKGDLLISRANTRELVGSAAVVPADFDRLLLCDKLYRLRLIHDECLPDFAAAFLGTQEARSQIELDATGASSSMLNIGQSVVLELPLPLPKLEEQAKIVEFLQAEADRLDALSNNSLRAIALLMERRSALIAAAVTGQIDVRGTVTVESP